MDLDEKKKSVKSNVGNYVSSFLQTKWTGGP